MYVAYLFTIFYVAHWGCITFWFFFQLTVTISRVYWSEAKSPFSDYISSFWNWLDFVRFCLMGVIVGRAFYLLDAKIDPNDKESIPDDYDFHFEKDVSAYLALVSWI
jgi:hypothetical protein